MNETMKNLSDVRQSDSLLPVSMKEVEDKIAVIRGVEVIADADVAELYGVETKRVNEAVRNNPDKFPAKYMFLLTDKELRYLRSKISSTNVSSARMQVSKETTHKLIINKIWKQH